MKPKTRKRKPVNQKTIIIKEKSKRRSNFWRNFYNGVKNWFSKYHIPVFTLSISVFASIGVVAYSALGGEKLFPSFGLGFMLILILEFGFVALRYIAVSIGVSRTTMFFINIFIVFLFILTVSPATIGINQKVLEDRQGPGESPVKSSLIASLESSNSALNDKIKKNSTLIINTTSPKILKATQAQNNDLLKQIEENRKIIIQKENDYDTALKEYNNKKVIAESKDPFVIFMRDFYLRFMIPGVQILNFFMSILGAGYLKRLKNVDTVIPVSHDNRFKILIDALYNRLYSRLIGTVAPPVDLSDRLADHEKRMEQIEKYTNKVVEDMEELAGELNIPVKPAPARNVYKDKKIEEQTKTAAVPEFFKTTTEIGGKKSKKR